MPLPGDAIPGSAGVALLVHSGFHVVIGKESVAVFDVVEALNDGFRRERGGSPGAEVPLQVTDPEDEVGDGGGAGIHLESLELVRIDGESGFVQCLLRFAKGFERIVDLAFETLEMFEGHIEEVAGAAGRVEHLDGTEASSKVSEYGDRVRRFASAFERERGGLHVGPILAKRFDDGGNDEAFDVGTRSVVSAEGVALARVESAFEERAENGGLDIFPFGGGGETQDLELLAIEG